ncbi:MAG: GNAT family N-acetyltransferase [Rhizobiales bacterium]|nr:GNAT family N-acetyltransferase [Hyphomicrobiales bacterium]
MPDRDPPPLTGPRHPGLLSTLQAYGGLQVAPARAFRRHDSLGRIGPLEVRLAQSAAEVRQAQKLRYRVFYKEGTAIPDPARLVARRDVDAFDAICDHLLVIDHSVTPNGTGNAPAVVGTYRLLRQEVAEDFGGFYTASEFDIGGLLARHADLKFLELGRSCVLAPYRNKRTVELLWAGIWNYVRMSGLDVMFGCASLDGTDPQKLAQSLSFLHHYARAPEEWRASALPERYVDMNMLSKESIDPKTALRALPPLIKGYLRLGCYIGDGAVIDHQFGTTDVLIMLPVSALNERYIQHFGADGERHAA